MPDDEIKVEQCDREAAAAYWKVSRIGTASTQRRYLSGEADNSFIVQAFARHRIAHGAQGEPDLATIAYMSGRKDMAAQLAEAQREIERLQGQLANAQDAMLGPLAWLETYARHIGDCPGNEGCTCGLTFMRHELGMFSARAALEAKP